MFFSLLFLGVNCLFSAYWAKCSEGHPLRLPLGAKPGGKAFRRLMGSYNCLFRSSCKKKFLTSYSHCRCEKIFEKNPCHCGEIFNPPRVSIVAGVFQTAIPQMRSVVAFVFFQMSQQALFKRIAGKITNFSAGLCPKKPFPRKFCPRSGRPGFFIFPAAESEENYAAALFAENGPLRIFHGVEPLSGNFQKTPRA